VMMDSREGRCCRDWLVGGGDNIPLSVVSILRAAVRASSASARTGVARATALSVEGLGSGVGTAEDGGRGEDADVNHDD